MVVSYMTKLLKYFIKNVALTLHPLFKNYIYTVNHGIAKGLKKKGGLGFVPYPMPLTQEERFLINLDLKDQTIYDIGGYEGVFTLFFARAVGEGGRVITFEPNTENFKKIVENVKLNKFDNVKIIPIGLGKNREKMKLTFCRSDLGIGSVQEEIKRQILSKKGARTIEVEIDSLDNQIRDNNLPLPDFVKIDVEGLEMDVLLGMRETIKYKPKFFIEIHGIGEQRKIENAKRVIEFLIANSYSIYHIESKEKVSLFNAQIAKEGHLYCI